MAETRAEGRATPSGGVRPLRSRWARLALVASVVGPGIITANVDNDAGGIATYSQAGADFGYLLLWTLIPITFALILVQEMSARMGVVTGKGLSDLIRERFGVKTTFFVMLALVVANLGNTVAEFAASPARWRSSAFRAGCRCPPWRCWSGSWW
jgi:Mn2+/Fe2+ NRAMP family transporter